MYWIPILAATLVTVFVTGMLLRCLGIRIQPTFARHYFCIGILLDKTNKRLYIMPVPMFGIYFRKISNER